MHITPLPLSGLVLFEPTVYQDDRGFFLESYRQITMQQALGNVEFVQDNHSKSTKGTLRGLHFQSEPGQGKLVRCTQGAVWDVAVDLRPHSPTFRQWHALELSQQNFLSIYIPVGFAHGFAVLTDVAEVQYKCTSYYNGATEKGIAWNDPELAINWPVDQPLLSARDQELPTLAQWLNQSAL
ncbi:MAG: dTDP-4-dehydrorhamnose 3,5-epimerase [Sumerlaeia bacterium]